MARLTDVPVNVLNLERFAELLQPEAYARFSRAVDAASTLFEGRVIWNVNSTPKGGGVAEMLRSLLAYVRGAGVDARWIVVSGDDPFFALTKRIHNHLHGSPGDGGDLGAAERAVYEDTLAGNGEELAQRVERGDIVVLHDPQTAGLVPIAKDAGAHVVWRCHVGVDAPNDRVRGAWDFLQKDVAQADLLIFSRAQFIWDGLERARVAIIPPSIDAFSAKNQDIDARNITGILVRAGILADGDVDPEKRVFLREDGTPGRVDRSIEAFDDQPDPVPPGAKIVTQVSRWDRLKDPAGVMKGFTDHVAPATTAHLVVAGPSVAAVADDPEGLSVLQECHAAWKSLPADLKERVHLVCLPMEDGEENAAIVNALQRRADVVVQKSIAEGFGLTVAEAMWKARPVVASRTGGIQDQIEHGVSGHLLDDPANLKAYGAAVVSLLQDEDRAAAMGAAAKDRIRTGFLATRHLGQYIDLFGPLLD